MDESDLSAAPRTKRQSRPNPKYLQSQSFESEYELSASDEEDEPVSKKKKGLMPKIKLLVPLKRKEICSHKRCLLRGTSMNVWMNMKKEGKRKTNSCHKICFYINTVFSMQAVRIPLQLSTTTDNFPIKVHTFIHQL